MRLRALAAFVMMAACQRPERIVSFGPKVDAAVPEVKVDLPKDLRFTLQGQDFEDARGKSCPLEAIVDAPDAGEMPVLRFRCAQWGAP